MAHITYDVEYTDTFAGEANYCWVQRHKVTMPELTHYGYDGHSGYAKANKVFQRELMRKAKAACGLTDQRGTVSNYGDTTEFRPYKACTVMFITWCEPGA